MRRRLEGANAGSAAQGHILWPAFRGNGPAKAYRVPAELFADIIAGQRQDLAPVMIPDFAELHQYCYRRGQRGRRGQFVCVWALKGGEETLKLGVARGIAFQLTNILRDLHEDARPPRQRCYLPLDDLVAGFGRVARMRLARGVDSRGGIWLPS